MAELNNKSQRLSRRATKSKTQATKSRIYASSLCKFSSGLTRLYSVSLLWIERSSVMTVLAHKRRARPAHLKKGIYDSHHHAKRYRDREPARAHRDERDDKPCFGRTYIFRSQSIRSAKIACNNFALDP